jgi:tetratricopeptide (TPR) repeat protein
MALAAFNDSRRVMSKLLGPSHPKISMVLNNIACCNFQMGNSHSALLTLKEARDNHKQHVAGSSAQADLDLLHTAITLSNYGYLKLNLKQYEEAAACFEEALLVRLSSTVCVRGIAESKEGMRRLTRGHSLLCHCVLVPY